MKKLITFVLLFAICFSAKAQTDSLGIKGCNLRISLLTCSPGAELYSTFGHSALRVINETTQEDIVFNYGTFDFDDPHFYSKFIRGKLLYFVSVYSFSDFMQQYQYEGRGVIEQVLNLSCEEKQNLFAALMENAKDENKYYKYDFIYDNCTTRLRDIVKKEIKEPFVTKNIRPEEYTKFLDLIHEYLDKGKEYWSKLGIDIILGAPVRNRVSNEEAMFLPDYLMKGFDSTIIGSKKLVSEKNILLHPSVKPSGNFWLSPLFVFWILAAIILVLSFIKKAAVFFKYFDFVLFFLTGALGILLLFMWLGTDHQACKYNLNLLWAFPANIVIAFLLNKKRKWVRTYLKTYCILATILWWLSGDLSSSAFPILLIISIRSYECYKKLKVNVGKKPESQEKLRFL